MENVISTEVLFEKWNDLLNDPDLPAIKGDSRKAIIARLLENQEGELVGLSRAGQQTYLVEAPANASAGFPDNNANLAGYSPIMIGMVRRAYPNLLPLDVCGTQVMNAPTGLIFCLRSRYSTQGGTEALFNEANSAFSGTGVQAGTDPMPQANLNTYKGGTGMTTTEGEALGDGNGTNIAQMAFSIGKVSVEAKTRALKACYTQEIQQDLKAVHGLDAEKELANILINEILSEQNREIIRTIYNNAVVGAADTTSAGKFDLDLDANGRWSVERFKGLMFQIERDANAIAVSTRRGRGNIVICSADVASALSIAGLLDCGSALKDNLSHDGVVNNPFVGILNGRFKCYVDPYVPSNSGYYVVGYKGASQYDAGLFFTPYTPLTIARAIDPVSLQPVVGFKTRYGLVANPFATAAGTGALGWNTNVYYRKVEVASLL